MELRLQEPVGLGRTRRRGGRLRHSAAVTDRRTNRDFSRGEAANPSSDYEFVM